MTEKAPNSVLNVKALIGAFNQEKALVGAFSVIIKLRVIFVKVHLKLYLLPSPELVRARGHRIWMLCCVLMTCCNCQHGSSWVMIKPFRGGTPLLHPSIPIQYAYRDTHFLHLGETWRQVINKSYIRDKCLLWNEIEEMLVAPLLNYLVRMSLVFAGSSSRDQAGLVARCGTRTLIYLYL